MTSHTLKSLLVFSLIGSFSIAVVGCDNQEPVKDNTQANMVSEQDINNTENSQVKSETTQTVVAVDSAEAIAIEALALADNVAEGE